jgi:hypothetical protein
MLRNRGFRAFAIRGGFLAWKQAGLALEPKDFEKAAAGQVCTECGRLLSEHEGHAHTASAP